MSNTTTSVNSGAVNTSGNRTYLTGIGSGLNTAALIEAAHQQRTAEADKIDIRIEKNNKRATALTDLQTLGTSLESSLKFLRNSYGFGVSSSSAFTLKAGALESSSNTSPTSLVNVTIDNNAAPGSYEFRVLQKATTQKVASAGVADRAAAMGFNGSFDIGLGTGATSTINVTAGMSMSDIANAINATSSTTNVTASVLKVSDNSYQLVLTGKETAQEISFSNITGDNVMESIGMINAGGAFVDQIQAAQVAQIEFDGVTITRSTNDFSDLIDGVNLSIKNAEPGTTLTLEVGNDTESVKNAISNFVAAYNDLRDFMIKHQTVNDGGVVSEDSVLYGDFMLKNMTQQLQSIMGLNFTTSSGISTLAEIGITFDVQNKMVLDEVKLEGVLANDFDSVRQMFETSYSSDNAQFTMMSNSSTYRGGNMTFDITHDGTSMTGVSVNGSSDGFEISGNAIIGKKGTQYEGLRFAYVGNTSTSISFTLNQGAADLLANTTFRYTDVVTGSIQQELTNIGRQNDTLTTQAERVRERADRYKDTLIQKYAQFEAVYGRAKQTLSQIRAILGTQENSR